MLSTITACRPALEHRVRVGILLCLALLPAAADTGKPLAAFDTGTYAEMKARPNPEGHAIVFVPALATVLLAAEESDGELGEAEALSLRDRAETIAIPAENARRLEAGRGYRDLDPENCWQDWQTRREELISP